MKLKLMFATASALALLMGAAYANDSVIMQSGDNNEALVSQDGGEGNDSSIGQSGDRNDADITQLSDGNLVGDAQQTSSAGAADPTNVLVITQGGSAGGTGGNIVTSVSQINSANGLRNLATITQKSSNNTLGFLSQNGVGNQATIAQAPNYGGGNAIGSAVQQGDGNVILTWQDGSLAYPNGSQNTIVSIEQDGTRNGTRIDQRGSNNGQGTWGGQFAASVLLDQGTVRQIGIENGVFENSVDGTDNQFAYSQNGFRNSAFAYQYDNHNEIAVLQWGDGNWSNNVQDGGSNDAGVSVNGHINSTSIRQYDGSNQASISVGWGTSGGTSLANDRNNADITQNGGSNGAHIDIDGSRNLANVVQLGGSGNAFQLSITGNDNNRGAFTAGGDAASVGGGLTIGLFTQDGGGNIFDVDVSGDSNQLASLQTGAGNEIAGSVNGSFNEAAVMQTGAGNYSFSSQTGSNNNIGVTQ